MKSTKLPSKNPQVNLSTSQRRYPLKPKWMTYQYIAALFALGVLVVSAYALYRSQLSASQAIAPLLNQSGYQRLLSQEIAMLAEDFVTTPANRNIKEEFELALKTFEQNHNEISGNDSKYEQFLVDEVKEYFEKDSNLNQMVENYLTQGYQLLQEEADKITLRHPAYQKIRSITRQGELLKALDGLVRLFEQISQEQISVFKNSIDIIVIIFLIALVLVAVFVLRPMVFQIQGKMKELQELNIHLEEKVLQKTQHLEKTVFKLQETQEEFEKIAFLVSKNVTASIDTLDETLEQKQERIEHVQKQRSQMRRFIESLHSYSRKDLELAVPEPIDLEEFLEEVVKQSGISQKTPPLISCEEPLMISPRELLIKVIESLLKSNSQSQEKRVEIDTKSERKWITFRIIDTCPEAHKSLQKRADSWLQSNDFEKEIAAIKLLLAKKIVESVSSQTISLLPSKEKIYFSFQWPRDWKHSLGDSLFTARIDALAEEDHPV